MPKTTGRRLGLDICKCYLLWCLYCASYQLHLMLDITSNSICRCQGTVPPHLLFAMSVLIETPMTCYRSSHLSALLELVVKHATTDLHKDGMHHLQQVTLAWVHLPLIASSLWHYDLQSRALLEGKDIPQNGWKLELVIKHYGEFVADMEEWPTPTLNHSVRCQMKCTGPTKQGLIEAISYMPWNLKVNATYEVSRVHAELNTAVRNDVAVFMILNV